jgi:hypothetical protein
MNPEIEINRIITEHKGVLVRQNKHEIWRFPDGKQVVLASTPSDRRAAANKLSVLRNVLGIKAEKAPAAKGNKGYRHKHEAAAKLRFTPSFNSSLADQLRLTGLVEDELRATIDCLEDEKAKLLEENSGYAELLVERETQHRLTRLELEAQCELIQARLEQTWDWRIRQWLKGIFSRS